MARFFRTIFRVLLGFAAACLVAGLVTVLFVDTPVELAAAPAGQLTSQTGQAFVLALLTATHAAIFASVFALIAAGLAEWLSIRTITYFLLAGTAIALLGYFAQYQSEVAGQPTILNNYALKAFLTAGFFAGITYWLFAGQFAGGPETATAAPGGPAVSAGDTESPPSPPPPLPSDGKQRLAELARKPAYRGKPVSPSVSSRIIDITTETGTKAAIGTAAAEASAPDMPVPDPEKDYGRQPPPLSPTSETPPPLDDLAADNQASDDQEAHHDKG